MQHKHLLLALLLGFGMATPLAAQKKATPKKKPTATATTAQPSKVNADSLEVRKLIDAAKKGDADAQNTLGSYYYTGKKVKQNYEVALKWFSLAAQQKHVQAIANMGLCYQLGRGTKADSLTAVKLYKESVKAGNADWVKTREQSIDTPSGSLFDLLLLADLYNNGCGSTVKKNADTALKYYKLAADRYQSLPAASKVAHLYDQAQKYAEALPYFKKAAKLGDGVAAYKLGDYLCNGKGTQVDKATAAQYLNQAVKQQLPQAMMLLGNLLYKGDGVSQDYTKALTLYKQAAVKNNPIAQWNLGIMYKKGQGVKPNYLIALQWLSMAANNGMKKNFTKQVADNNVEINNGWHGTDFYQFLQAIAQMEAAPTNCASAVKLLTALEKKNLPLASTLLGQCYADSTWKKANAKKMLAYYEKAATHDEPYACYLLAQLHLTGHSAVKTDKAQVVPLLEKAANGDYAPALCQLGDLYFTGKIVNKNITQAISYYNQALLNGHLTPTAATNLAQCYQQGLGGVTKNEAVAKEILKHAQKDAPWTALLQSISFD